MVEGFGFGCLGKGRIAQRAIAVGKAELPGSRDMVKPDRVPDPGCCVREGCEAGERVETVVEHWSVDELEGRQEPRLSSG